MKFEEVLKKTPIQDGSFSFQLDTELNGGFGGTNGGVLAAIAVNAARSVSNNRKPIGLDARFIKGFRPGMARVVATELNRGRTLSVVNVDIFNGDKLTTRCTVSLTEPNALASIDADDIPIPNDSLLDYADGKVWREPPGQPIPLIKTFEPRFMGKNHNGISTAIKPFWDEGDTMEEASCIAADVSVGPPVASALKGKPLAIPNPDLSLRFTGVTGIAPWLVSTCRLQSLNDGLATTQLEVRLGDQLTAVGISSTTCLKP